jgi:hypothetical protein
LDWAAVLGRLANRVGRSLVGRSAMRVARRAKLGRTAFGGSKLGRLANRVKQSLAGRSVMRAARHPRLGRAAAGVARGAAVRAGAAAVGRGALTGVLAGGRAGAALGAAAGPPGIIAGVVVGVVAAAGKALFDDAVGVFQTLAGSITRHLTPVAILGQAIQSSTSGYSVFSKAVGLLAATIGVALMPLFLALAAAVAMVAGKLAGPLSDAASKFAGPVMDGVMGAVAASAAAVEYATDVVIALSAGFESLLNNSLFKAVATPVTSTWRGMAGVAGWAAANPAAAATAATTVSPVGGLLLLGAATEGESFAARLRRKRQQFGLPDDTPAGSPNGTGKKGDSAASNAMRAVVDEFRRSLSGKAEATSLDSVGRSAQMAWLNMSPFEVETLKLQREALKVAEQQLAEQAAKAGADAPAGRGRQ